MGVTALISAPIYVHFLGIEAYGLIGFFLTLLGLSNILDLGFSSTISRELARSSVAPGADQTQRDLVRTLEVIYWALAFILGAVVAALAPTLASGWLKDFDLPVATISTVILLMGVALTFQWPLSLYSGGLMGLHRQVLLNGIGVVMVTIRHLGAIGVLLVGEPSIVRFFAWQAAVGAVHTVVVAFALWRGLPKGEPAQFRIRLLRQITRFAAGVSATAIVVIVVTQMDKVVLSRILSLEGFGYYSLATVVASGLMFLTLPIFQAVFPHFSALVARRDEAALVRVYHQSCQLMSVVVLPIAAVIAFFSFEVMTVWTGDQATVRNTHVLVRLLVIGTAMNGLVNVPYALQLANGWTSLVFRVNLVAAVAFVPALLVATHLHGAVGAAWVWLALNAGYLLVVVNLMHRRLLTTEKLRWFGRDVLLPLAATSVVTVTARLALPSSSSRIVTAVLLALVLVAALAASGMVTPATKDWVLRSVRLARASSRTATSLL